MLSTLRTKQSKRNQGGATTVTDTGFGEPLIVRKGPSARKNKRKARGNWYVPLAKPAPTTTRQAEILNTALVAAPRTYRGILIGRDCLSNSAITHDVFDAYSMSDITSPNVVIVGDVGSGKSSLCKTVYVVRPLLRPNRRVVVFDKKTEAKSNVGEYTKVVDWYGGTHIAFNTNGTGDTFNPMDPRILAGDGIAGQVRLLRTLSELVRGGDELDEWEERALRTAHREVLIECGWNGDEKHPEFSKRVPLLADIAKALPHIHKNSEFSDDGYSEESKERLHQAAAGVQHRIDAVIGSEFRGLFDGYTSAHVDLDDRLTSFDISQLPDDGPSVSMVIAVANMWLMGTIREQGDSKAIKTIVVYEEGWHLVGGPTGKLFRASAKLSRAFGICNVIALHHIADIPVDSPAIAAIKEAHTAHIFKQSRPEDVQACREQFSLEPGTQDLLTILGKGHHLLCINSQTEIHVEHIRSDIEVVMTDTDGAMLELLAA